MLANGALQNVYYPQTDNPDTFGRRLERPTDQRCR